MKSWAFNVLVFAIIQDMRWYGGGSKFAEALKTLEELQIPEVSEMTYESLRKHYDKIDEQDIFHLLLELSNECNEEDIVFISPRVHIPDLPPNFLVTVADLTGHKKNPYLSGDQPIPEDFKITSPNKKMPRSRN